MNTFIRFAATSAAIILSLYANASYGWQWGPYARAGLFLAALAVIFDVFKIILAPAIGQSLASGRRTLAAFQGLVFAGLVAMSLFTGFSFVAGVIAGDQHRHRQQAAVSDAAAAQVADLEARISGILNDRRAGGCLKIDGPYTRRWCSAVAPDGVPALKARLAKARKVAARKPEADHGRAMGMIAGLAGVTRETVMLAALGAMTILIEIVASFGILLLSSPTAPAGSESGDCGKPEPEATPEPAPEADAKPHTEADTIRMLADLGIGQKTIAKAMTDMGSPMSQSTVSRRLQKAK